MYGVILAGGSGTRFWPLSRKKIPKQFLKLFSERTLIEETVNRLLPLIPAEKILIVTTEEYRKRILEFVPFISPKNIIVEPVGRNTAPAIALAAFKLSDKHGEVMGVFPSDHLILKGKQFRTVLSLAEKVAKTSKHLITIGMKPDKPETGYGYIEMGTLYLKKNGLSVYSVRRFVEKPNPKMAKVFLAQKNFMWNSGMFVWRIDVFLKEVEDKLPDVYYGIKKGIKINRNGICEIDRKIYEGLQTISVDYGIMEKSRKTLVIPADIGWSDLGSWASLAEVTEHDEGGNSIIAGGGVMYDVSNSLFFAKDKFVAGIGVKDLIVVSEGNAILICRKDRSQDVKKIVEYLKREGKEDLL